MPECGYAKFETMRNLIRLQFESHVNVGFTSPSSRSTLLCHAIQTFDAHFTQPTTTKHSPARTKRAAHNCEHAVLYLPRPLELNQRATFMRWLKRCNFGPCAPNSEASQIVVATSKCWLFCDAERINSRKRGAVGRNVKLIHIWVYFKMEGAAC